MSSMKLPGTVSPLPHTTRGARPRARTRSSIRGSSIGTSQSVSIGTSITRPGAVPRGTVNRESVATASIGAPERNRSSRSASTIDASG